MVRIVVSYSHKDKELCDKLARHLHALENEGLVRIRYIHDNRQGTEAQLTADDHIGSPKIVLPLISPNYISGGNWHNRTIQQATEEHQEGTAVVIPVILTPSDWKDLSIPKLFRLPLNGTPVTEWCDHDAALLDIATEIERAIRNSRWHDRGPGDFRSALEQCLVDSSIRALREQTAVRPTVITDDLRTVVIRSEGIAELVDDIVFRPAANPTTVSDVSEVHLDLFVNTIITSRLLYGDVTETVLVIGSGSSAILRFGRIVMPHCLRFEHLPIMRFGGATWRIANLRVYAAHFGPMADAGSNITCIPVFNPPINQGGYFVPATTRQSLRFNVNPHEFLISEERQSFDSKFATLCFAEAFPYAFKPQAPNVAALGLSAPYVITTQDRQCVWSSESGATNALVAGAPEGIKVLGAVG